MLTELLLPEEIKQLTGCTPRDAQCSKLESMGVPFRRDGARILVSRDILRRWTCGEAFRTASNGPRWDLLNAPLHAKKDKASAL